MPVRASNSEPRFVSDLVAHEQVMARDLAALDISANPSEAIAMMRAYRHLLATIEAAVAEEMELAGAAEGTDGWIVAALARFGRPVRTVREVVLESLGDIGWPMRTRDVAAYAEVRYGRPIAADRFGSLAADEQAAAWRSGLESRPTWLAFG